MTYYIVWFLIIFVAVVPVYFLYRLVCWLLVSRDERDFDRYRGFDHGTGRAIRRG